jgi:hypothetical protein
MPAPPTPFAFWALISHACESISAQFPLVGRAT